MWTPRSRELPSNFVIKLGRQKAKALIGLYCSENCMILTSAILSQYTRVTDRWQTDRQQMTYHDNSRTLQWNCNFWLKTEQTTSSMLRNSTPSSFGFEAGQRLPCRASREATACSTVWYWNIGIWHKCISAINIMMIHHAIMSSSANFKNAQKSPNLPRS